MAFDKLNAMNSGKCCRSDSEEGAKDNVDLAAHEQRDGDGGTAFASLEAMLFEEEQQEHLTNLPQQDHARFYEQKKSASVSATAAGDEQLSAQPSVPHVEGRLASNSGPLVSGSLFNDHPPMALSRLDNEDQYRSLLNNSRLAVDRLHKREKRSLSSLGDVSSNEFISSTRGILIPKHWRRESSESSTALEKHKRPTSKHTSRSPPHTKAKSKRKLRNSVVPVSSLARRLDRKRDDSIGTQKKKSRKETRAISFAPPFAIKLQAHDPVVDDSFHAINDNSEDAALLSPQHQTSWWESSPRARRSSSTVQAKKPKSKIPKGQWAMLYEKFRDTTRADALRLRHSAGGDPMDPRKTASSFTDITIISNHSSPWNVLNRESVEENGSTILVHIHQKRITGSKRIGEDTSTSGLAWCYLPCATVRERRIRAGTQLRLYNAVVVKSNHDYWNIFASPLIEDHPASALRLPALSELKVQSKK